MSTFPQYRFRHALAAASLGLALAPSAPANAEMIRVGDMLRGVSLTQWQCSSIGQAVWVGAGGRNFCIRYYTSTAGGGGAQPVVFLQGDQLGRLDSQARNFNPPPDTKDTDTRDLQRLADSFSKAAGTSAIYLARIGVDGSSGHHRLRHSLLELQVTNAALEMIRQRHNYSGFHLVGQSGGATLVGGLLAMRNDIGCALPGAGRLAHLRRYRTTNDPARDVFDPYDAVQTIARNSKARILVITDPQDQVVKLPHQATFVFGLRRAGKAVTQFYVQAIDPKHHGMVAYTRAAVALCVRGAPDSRIETALNILGQKRVAWAAARGRGPAFAAAPATPGAPVMQPPAPRHYASTATAPFPGASAYAPPRFQPSPTTNWPKLRPHALY